MEWKNCPYCDKRINQKAKKCPYCHYDFEKDCLGIEVICNSITTKSVNKNSLSFECPIYYDIGIFRNEDETYKSIVLYQRMIENAKFMLWNIGLLLFTGN